MSAAFQLYRKAIAALIGGLLPLVASFIPGAEALADPMTVNVASIIGAAIFAAVTADKIDGASVVELARVVVDALDRMRGDPDKPEGAFPGTADTVVMRTTGPAASITATPLPAKVAVAVASTGIALKSGGDA